MIGIQLGLIDQETGAVLVPPMEIHEEDDYSFMQMTEIAKRYGTELGRMFAERRLSESNVDNRIIGFVDGMNAVRLLSADEREWLRNDVLNAVIAANNGRLWEAVTKYL